MVRLACVLLSAAGLLACKRADPPAAPPPPAPAIDGGAFDAAAATGAPPAPPVAPAAPLDPTAIAAEARDLLARWLRAQNGGDAGAYAVLYDVRSFRGVKRTIAGKAQTFDAAGWLRDRRRMFRHAFSVAADDVQITTWLDPGSPLPVGVASLRFVQRWQGGGYADHGTKVLQAWRDPAGRWRIVYEDLLNSEPGWDRAPAHVTPLALTPPADDAAARALWRVVAPTGADYHDKLAAIPLDPAIARPMARALLAEGNLDCKMVVPAASCGETLDELAPVRPDATIEDPCLRRRLVGWAVDRLTPADARAVAPALLAMASLPMPEIDLPEHALRAVPRPDHELRLQVLAAAVEAGHAAIADDYVADLTGGALVRAASELGLDRAVSALAVRPHRQALVAAIDDDRLEVATRLRVIERLAGDRGDDVAAALIATTDDDDCQLAMTAAAALANRGDRSYLPRRPDPDGKEALIRALCLAAHDPDQGRRERLFSALVRRGATLTADRYAEALDNDEGDGQSSEESPLTADNLLHFDGALGICRDGECAVGEDGTTVTFATSRQGRLVVSGVRTRTHVSCGCELIEFGAR